MDDPGLGAKQSLVKPLAAAPRFSADVMLGRLVRWLRILGFDVEFGPDFDDDSLVRRANRAGRILLTADSALVARAALHRGVLLPPSGLREQWIALRACVDLNPWMRPFSRCPGCNIPFRPLARDRARDRVPPHVFDAHERFLECTSCKKVFWPGSHRAHMERLLDELIRASTDA